MPAYAHAYQALVQSIRLLAPKKGHQQLPSIRTTTGTSGIELAEWSAFSDSGTHHQDGETHACWSATTECLDNVRPVLFGLVVTTCTHRSRQPLQKHSRSDCFSLRQLDVQHWTHLSVDEIVKNKSNDLHK